MIGNMKAEIKASIAELAKAKQQQPVDISVSHPTPPVSNTTSYHYVVPQSSAPFIPNLPGLNMPYLPQGFGGAQPTVVYVVTQQGRCL